MGVAQAVEANRLWRKVKLAVKPLDGKLKQLVIDGVIRFLAGGKIDWRGMRIAIEKSRWQTRGKPNHAHENPALPHPGYRR